ncbi:LOW QUALITY PROTEIN: hypothetical protein AJ78_01620 [Emergomyces pasteurianus Ep9510]|uniref:Uncharacterized protein n=1 Tax=Emergomyces pasteurianus Ep9510 TaxID=1447872 RepID=A0A1J9PPG9_9EURO|nr:LOW QUALITY PROTEIN: hypothetical protein AJ78_01620 [Emergomyces pasteurianus Ep9510]
MCHKRGDVHQPSICETHQLRIKLDPEVIDPHPSSDLWIMLPDIRLFFDPLRVLKCMGKTGWRDAGKGAVAEREGRGGSGGQHFDSGTHFDRAENGDCPETLRKNHLVYGRGRGNYGDKSLGIENGVGVWHLHLGQMVRKERGTIML